MRISLFKAIVMDQIVSPSLVVDEEKCKRNIRHMAAKAEAAGVEFRPHFKTHQSHQIGRWFREVGVDRIAVSSLSMAEYFALDGWTDIMVAFPVNIRETGVINDLASKIRLSLLIADASVVGKLSNDLRFPVGYYIKIDVGNHRSGFLPDQINAIEDVISQSSVCSNLEFRGFLAHAGQTYSTHSLNDVHKVYKHGVKNLGAVASHFRSTYPGIITSWGDTPTCSIENEFDGIDEIRPGNFVFYDLTQFHLASCDWEQIAVAVAAPVVSKQLSRNEIVVYGGAVHLSKDSLKLPEEGRVYGEVVKLNPRGWERFSDPLYLGRISQEHGIFKCPDEYWDQFCVGDLVGIVPVHSCLAADLLRGKFYNLKTATFF
jgi:D-serine deaminase-like pyridoxal phosphate-dependent protein